MDAKLVYDTLLLLEGIEREPEAYGAKFYSSCAGGNPAPDKREAVELAPKTKEQLSKARHEMGRINAALKTIRANIHNGKLSDADFRKFIVTFFEDED